MNEAYENLIDLQTEGHVIGSLIANPSLAYKVRGFLVGSDFSDPNLGRVYELILDTIDSKEFVGDAVSFATMLARTQAGVNAGGTKAIFKLVAAAPTSSCVADSRRVSELSGLRKIVRIASRMYGEAQRIGAKPEPISMAAQGELQTAIRSTESEIISFYEAGMMNVAKVQEAAEARQSTPEYISTGLQTLDRQCGGFFRGDLNVIAARPSVGKTALAVQMAVDAAILGHRVLIVSLEMTGKSLAARVQAARLGIENRAIRSSRLTPEDQDRLVRETQSWEGLPLDIWHPKGRATVSQISSLLRVRKASVGLDMVVIDYFQRIRPESKYGQQRLDQLEGMVADIKTIGSDLNIVNVLIAQLNRGAEGERPKLSDIKGCGAVEEDADGVLLLWRGREENKSNVFFAKQRNGSVGEVTLGFDPGGTRYFDIEEYA